MLKPCVLSKLIPRDYYLRLILHIINPVRFDSKPNNRDKYIQVF